jgi:hypothetical protein
MRQRPGSIIAEAPLVTLDRNERIRLVATPPAVDHHRIARPDLLELVGALVGVGELAHGFRNGRRPD